MSVRSRLLAIRDRTNLVIAGAEHELGVGVEVQDALHDLALVHRERADFEVLLPDEDCRKRSVLSVMTRRWAQRTLNRPLARKVVLEQVLALMALEETIAESQQSAHMLVTVELTPTRDPPNDNAT